MNSTPSVAIAGTDTTSSCRPASALTLAVTYTNTSAPSTSTVTIAQIRNVMEHTPPGRSYTGSLWKRCYLVRYGMISHFSLPTSHFPLSVRSERHRAEAECDAG